MVRNIMRVCFGMGLILCLWGHIAPVAVNAQSAPPFDFIELDGSLLGGLGGFAWHPDGDKIAVGVGNNVRIYNSSLQILAEFTGHTDIITGVDWNHDGSALASRSMDNSIRIWQTQFESVEFGTQTSVLQEDGLIISIVWVGKLIKFCLGS